MIPSAAPKNDAPSSPLGALVAQLAALGGRLARDELVALIARSGVGIDDVAQFVAPTPDGYARRRVALTDSFELLVMTWLPGQGSGPHDHAGSLSAFKVLRGTAHETRFAQRPDGLVGAVETLALPVGAVGLDEGDAIHAVRNESRDELLVSLHAYAPPLPELRRFAAAATVGAAAAAGGGACARAASAGAACVAIVGGGFSGSMVAAHLLRRAAQSGGPLHLVLIDRQTSIAEGAAYRTADDTHLLNVPASGMSAWPDRPTDFLDWARGAAADVGAYSFLPRHRYGEYLRDTLFGAIAGAGAATSLEIRRAEVRSLAPRAGGGWRIHSEAHPPLEADALVLATGHRPPDDPLQRVWSGPRTRYIEDPWATLALTAIGAGESVCLLGTGLTAVDVLRSVSRGPRSAPVLALSRRGLLPSAHAPAPLPPVDPRPWLEPLLQSDGGLGMRRLTRHLRDAVRAAAASGADWRQVIDGLRPHLARIWGALPRTERRRFLRHVKPLWEILRHRTAPAVDTAVRQAAAAGIFRKAAARILAARGSAEGVSLTIGRRGRSAPETLHFDWVVNCTGPGSGGGSGLPPAVAGLVAAGRLTRDELGLGVHCAADGRALAGATIVPDLAVVGTLRKADLWESTAVPELRQQAALAAEAVWSWITRPRPG